MSNIFLSTSLQRGNNFRAFLIWYQSFPLKSLLIDSNLVHLSQGGITAVIFPLTWLFWSCVKSLCTVSTHCRLLSVFRSACRSIDVNFLLYSSLSPKLVWALSAVLYIKITSPTKNIKLVLVHIWACPQENLPYGILLTVMLFACTVIMFARITILQNFENGIQLLACCIFIVWGIILIIENF